MWYTEDKKYVWVKYHFLTERGIKNFTDKEATILSGTNPDLLTNELYYNISKGVFPSWKMYIQVMTSEQAKTYKFDPFDTTKVWYHKDFPLIPVGKITLNRLPENFFAEVEQAAFCPGNMVPGIAGSPDKMLQARMVSYTDAQRHRLGPNAHMIPINTPKNATVKTYQRDGKMNVSKNGGNSPNYFPNSFDNSTTNIKYAIPPTPVIGDIARHEFNLTPKDYEQAGELYRRVLSKTDKDNLISNIYGSLSKAIERIQYRQTAIFYLADKEYGTRVAESLGLDIIKVERLANMTNEERIKRTSK